MTNPNDPAFVRRQVPKNPPKKDDAVYEHGLTKREYFAAMALGGLLARKSDSDTIRLAVLASIECADVIIAELSKGGK